VICDTDIYYRDVHHHFETILLVKVDHLGYVWINWRKKKISNPHHFDILHPSRLDKIEISKIYLIKLNLARITS